MYYLFVLNALRSSQQIFIHVSTFPGWTRVRDKVSCPRTQRSASSVALISDASISSQVLNL